MVRAVPHGWPGLIGECRSTFFLSYSNRSLIGRSGITESPGPEINTVDAF